MKVDIQSLLEKGIFTSRWLLAPIYLILSTTLFLITIKVIQEIIHFVPVFFSSDIKELLLFVLRMVDLALIGNLVLMIIFAGYENFVSKIDIAKDSDDKPSWMGKVDFSGLKIKLIASILAISGIGLLEAFMSISEYTSQELNYMLIIHVVFIASGVLLALMDYLAAKAHSVESKL